MSDTILENIREQVNEAVERGYKSGELTNIIYLLSVIDKLKEQVEEFRDGWALTQLRAGNFTTTLFEDEE